MITTLTVILIVLGGFAAYVRLAPSDPARWNADPTQAFAGVQGPNDIVTQTNGAVVRIPVSDGLLARFDAIAMATPHTTRLAGSVDQTRITWVTRSALWGFPDYTTAQINADGLYIHARLRFGKSDLGVNAARLSDWLAKL